MVGTGAGLSTSRGDAMSRKLRRRAGFDGLPGGCSLTDDAAEGAGDGSEASYDVVGVSGCHGARMVRAACGSELGPSAGAGAAVGALTDVRPVRAMVRARARMEQSSVG